MFFERVRSGPLGVALLQMAAALLLGIGICCWVDDRAALSAAYGAVVALLATLLLWARKREAEVRGDGDARGQLGAARRAVWERLALIAVLLALGFSSGRGEPRWMILGFIAGQSLWFAAWPWLRVMER